MTFRLCFASCCLLFALFPARGDDPATMMHAYLMGLTHAAADARALELDAIDSTEALAAYADSRREAFLDALGPWPDRTPLNPQTTGVIEREGYTIEKVMFESQPNHHVTALLYLPKGEGPHPAVLVPCGHAREGKAAQAYQRGSMLLAEQGIAAFCFDPIEQGERIGMRNEDGSDHSWGTEAHMAVGAGSILLGTNTASYEIWDGMRAIDYLLERREIDSTRIGCAGNSGGGTQTAYLMALDERIAVAAPSCYITSFPRLLDTIGAQDAEQNIHGQLAAGLDHADYLILRAPKPTLICAATKDFFDIGGTWDSYRDAKRVFTTLGYPERVALAEANEGHGWSQPLREATAQWMQRWLLGIDEPVREGDLVVLSPDEAQVTETGQVMDLPGERSSFDLNRERLANLREARTQAWAALSDDEKRATVRAVTGIREADAIDPARARQDAPDWFPEAVAPDLERITLETDEGIRLPAAISGDLVGKQVSLVLPGADGEIEALLSAEAEAVAVVFLRGLGPTKSARGSTRWAERFGSDWAEAAHAYLHGRSFVAMRAEDIVAVAHWLHEQGAAAITIIAGEEAATPVLHAAFLEPALFRALEVPGGIHSWERYIDNPAEPTPHADVIHGALTVYDRTDLVAAD